MRERGRGFFRSSLIAASAVVLVAWLGTPAAARSATGGSVAPNPVGTLDCNHLSTIQQAVRIDGACTDMFNPSEPGGHFEDNGHYVGHDEPDLRFVANAQGSGNNVTWTERLGSDPSALPTVSTPGSDVTHWFELTIAPWFSMDLCNPNSYPLTQCTPNSDANAPAPCTISPNPCAGGFPGGGSAFLELQFYPPGFGPFIDNISCDNTHWCASLHINDAECTFNFAQCNGACIEPTNFAFIQTDGVPTGPPSPQLSNSATFTPTSRTLLMNPGDSLRVKISDRPVPGGGGAALLTSIQDLTTGQSGFMQASAANGFMSTSITDCSGTPFNYEPAYSTSAAGNISPWTALRVNVSTQYEIGHFTPCSSLGGRALLNLGNGLKDPFWSVCNGPYEAAAPGGDGGSNPEASDALCFPAGDTHRKLNSAPNQVTGCADDFLQNGDLDFDGSPYWADWPTGAAAGAFPAAFEQQPPTFGTGKTYAQFQFQTDAALSEANCTRTTLANCVVPPTTAPGAFYPFWTLVTSGRGGANCVWEFGNVSNGNAFGGVAQYGTQRSATLGYPEIIGPLHVNTCG